MKNFLLIFLGGGIGSALRYLIGRWVSIFYVQTFPVATFLANVLACFILGLVIGLADHRQVLGYSARLFWAVGFCGGFSTFSTFSQETLSIVQSGQELLSILYVCLSIFFCIAATFVGQYLMRG